MSENGNTGEINIGIRSKQMTGGLVRLTVGGGIASSLSMLDNAELLTILHTLSRSKYTETTDKTYGFPYAFPIIFGE